MINIMDNYTIITEPLTGNNSMGDMIAGLFIFGMIFCCVCHKYFEEKKQDNNKQFISEV